MPERLAVGSRVQRILLGSSMKEKMKKSYPLLLRLSIIVPMINHHNDDKAVTNIGGNPDATLTIINIEK